MVAFCLGCNKAGYVWRVFRNTLQELWHFVYELFCTHQHKLTYAGYGTSGEYVTPLFYVLYGIVQQLAENAMCQTVYFLTRSLLL